MSPVNKEHLNQYSISRAQSSTVEVMSNVNEHLINLCLARPKEKPVFFFFFSLSIFLFTGLSSYRFKNSWVPQFIYGTLLSSKSLSDTKIRGALIFCVWPCEHMVWLSDNKFDYSQ